MYVKRNYEIKTKRVLKSKGLYQQLCVRYRLVCALAHTTCYKVWTLNGRAVCTKNVLNILLHNMILFFETYNNQLAPFDEHTVTTFLRYHVHILPPGIKLFVHPVLLMPPVAVFLLSKLPDMNMIEPCFRLSNTFLNKFNAFT